ncbi:hypothetical protein [Haematobacter genomosp. 1]|uniref:hypothetical protein n=1 Tax=Haematobacter genomosp. 1 TaxID=366618 RepID=UPI0015C63722|nr:hypothetical protein [Haematobacter genomosp. 1]
MIRAFHRLAFPALLLLLAACGGIGERRVVQSELPPMGEFRLGYNIVVAKNAQKVPISREVTTEQLETALRDAVQERFGSYEGRKLYHIAINVDAYALGPPGVPVVASPKSVLVISANVWDDIRRKKINTEPKQLTIWENLTGATFVGSGLTQNAESQLRNLARNAAKEVQDWMLEHPEWFELTPEDEVAMEEARAAAAAEARRTGGHARPATPPNP